MISEVKCRSPLCMVNQKLLDFDNSKYQSIMLTLTYEYLHVISLYVESAFIIRAHIYQLNVQYTVRQFIVYTSVL